MLWLSKWALNQARALISWNSVINFFRSYFGTVSAFFFTLYQRKCKQMVSLATKTSQKKKRLPNYVKHCSHWFLARSKEKVTVRVLGEQGMSTSHSSMCFVGGTCVFFWEITVELHSVQFWHGSIAWLIVTLWRAWILQSRDAHMRRVWTSSRMALEDNFTHGKLNCKSLLWRSF